MTTYVLAISIALQFAAAFMSFRLIRLTGRRVAWSLITAALILMAGRRLISFSRILAGDSSILLDPTAELVALAISILMVVGIAGIAPFFSAIHQSEETLKRREKLYRTFFESSMDMVLLKDDELRHIMVNKSLMDFMGKEENEIIGKTDAELLPQSIAQVCRQTDMEAIRSGGVVLSEEPMHGGIYETRKFAVPLGDGKTGVGAYIRDITDRKRAAEELREKDKFLESIVQSSAVATFVVNAEHKVIYWNRACEDLTGIKSEDLLGTSDHWKAFYEHRRPCVADIIIDNAFNTMTDLYKVYAKSVLIPDGIRAEGWYPNLGGKDRYIVFDAAPIRDDNGKLTAAIETLQDITERKRAEEALRVSEGKYRAILENIQEGYYEVDLAGSYTFFNPSMSRIIGYTEEEMMGMNYRTYMDKETAKKIYRHFNEIYRTGIPSSVDYEQTRKDGSKVFAETSVALMRDSSGKPIGFRGVVRDVTERKQMENEIRRNYDTQDALNFILRRSLENISLEEMLKQALDLVLSIPWLALEVQGGIFLVEDEPDVLVMKVQNNLAEPIQRMCARVPFGKCFCGRAASMRKIQFSDHLDERHEISYEGMRPHGHYCAPILSTGRTIGVLTLYIKEGHHQDQKEEEFLTAIADSLAGIIERKRAADALQEGQRQQKALLDNIPDIAWLKDKESRFIAANEPFGKACGFEPEDLVGKTDLDIWPRDLAERYRADDKEVMESGKRKQVEEPLTDSEGKSLWIETIKTPIYDEQGNVLGTAGIARDITERKQSFERLRKALGATVQAIAVTVETRDPYTAGHQRRVADLARAIATEMGLTTDQIDSLRMAGIIHDLGKIAVPAEILSKPTKLTNVEFSLIKIHAQSGYDILKDIEFPWPIARMVLEHHERMDGSGYPNGLTGDKLLIESRILTVADVVESMASHRPYRPSLGIDAALAEIGKNRGILYDEAVVDACLRLFRGKDFQLKET